MKTLLFSITKDDLVRQTFRSGGKGGQNQNKRDTGVRFIHQPSGARGEARDTRSQAQNEKLAFERLAADPRLRTWIRLEVARLEGKPTPEQRVDESLVPANLRVETRQPWASADWLPSVFVNPPYSKAREPWVRRCVAYGGSGPQPIALLIPAHTDTRIWHEAYATATSVCFIRGRVKFGVLRANRRQEAASHPSAILGWNTFLGPCSVLGSVTVLR